ncbi:MAG TPA: DASH family cryptochrome [Marinobacterium sp.]|nr:DASH family cryptochrome [Marinobacterium sp.]
MPGPTLLWFTHNLRLDDNPALQAASDAEQLICLFVVEPSWSRPNRYSLQSIGQHRRIFLNQSLEELAGALKQRGQQLILRHDTPLSALTALVQKAGISRILTSEHPGSYERETLRQIASRFPHLRVETVACNTLFNSEQLPFKIDELPESFSSFRRKVEKRPLQPPAPLEAPNSLPPAVKNLQENLIELPLTPLQQQFTGGETAAQAQLDYYFGSSLPASYKETRNGLDGWDYSSKFSAWLANGSLSARRLWQRIEQYEDDVLANESTYWLKFELLWREYFQWYGHRYGALMFNWRGPFRRSPLTSFYPERFKAWCEGSTPYPIVNAAMRQLNATGYMSNRARQLVASAFVHELQLDWRYGAAYFEQQLIDYDVASNWGNWQYLAGVGADPRGHRRFDLNKQAKIYDPEGNFIKAWKGEENAYPLPNRDYYDWPAP